MKIIYGAVRPDEGEIRWNGRPCRSPRPPAARALGISMVYQHFSLFDTLTAAENVWLGLDKVAVAGRGDAAHHARSPAIYGLEVDPLRPVHTLSVGERQRVEIVRALMTNPKLLILDEPTSVLTPQAVADPVRHAAQARRRRLLASSTSRTSSTRSAPSATTAPCCAAARSPARSTRPTETNAEPVAPDDRRRAAAAAAPARPRRRGGARGDATCRCRRKTTFGTTLEAISLRRARAARCSASPASRATASRS